MDAVRVTNRIVAALLAVALIVGGALVAIEVALAAAGQDPWIIPYDSWHQSAEDTTWADPAAQLLFALVALAGLVLLLLELARRRAPALALAGNDADARADLDRHGIERWLATRLADVEGVTGTRAKVRKRVVDVSAQTPQRDTGDVEQRLEQAARSHIDELDLAHPLKVRAKVSSRRSS